MAGEGDAERLVVLLEARIKDFEKNLAKASGTATKSYGGMRRDSKTATGAMEADMMRSTGSVNRALAATSTKIGGLGKSMIAGFAGGLVAGGLAGIVSRLGQVASGVAEIGDEARKAGLSVKSFQELKYVAEQNRVGVDALTDGIKELNLRADEFIVTGGGSAADAFKRLGYGAEELNTKLQDPSALFTEIIGKLQGLDRAAQIRISDELFGGTGGEQFVQLISQGEEGIKRTIDEAHSLGLVMSEELVKKAAEVDRKFNMVANTVGSALKGAIVEATAALNDFLNALGQTPAQHFGELNDRIAGMRDEMELFAQATARVAPESEADIRKIIDAVNDSAMGAEEAGAALRKMASINMDLFPITTSLSGIIALLENVSGKARAAAADIAAAASDPVKGGGPDATWENMQGTFFPKPRTVPGSGAAKSSATTDAEKQAKAVQNLIAGLEFEKSVIGMSAVEQAKMNALRQAGAAATDEQRTQISHLVEQTYSQQSAYDAMNQTLQIAQDMTSSFSADLLSGLHEGKSAAEALQGAFSNLGDQLLQMATDQAIKSLFSGIMSIFSGGGGGGGGNWFTSILGTLFGGGGGGGGLKLGYNLPSYDGGGYTGAGSRSGGIDGKGGFPAIMHPNETVNDHTKGAAANSNVTTQVHVTVGWSRTADGNLRPFVEEVSAGSAARVTSAAMPSIVEQSTAASGSALAGGKFDRGMASYGVSRQARRR